MYVGAHHFSLIHFSFLAFHYHFFISHFSLFIGWLLLLFMFAPVFVYDVDRSSSPYIGDTTEQRKPQGLVDEAHFLEVLNSRIEGHVLGTPERRILGMDYGVRAFDSFQSGRSLQLSMPDGAAQAGPVISPFPSSV